MPSGSRTRALLYTAAILWILCLTWFSVLHVVRHAPPGTTLHRVEHVIVFGVLGLLLLPLSRSRVNEWLTVLAILGFAAATEMGQHLVFRTPFELFDVRDDAIGLLMAWLVVRSARRKLV